MKSLISVLCLVLFFSPECYGQRDPKLISSVVSDCKRDCYIEANLTSLILKDEVLTIEAGVNLNCGGDFATTFELSSDDDTLNLLVYRKPLGNGSIAHRSCNCYYELSYVIGNVNHLPKTVLINGKTFEENRRDAGWINLDKDKH